MLSLDETEQLGLTFVKKQFLPRTGIQYVDLVELLKTRFINPNFPAGQGADDIGKHPLQLPLSADAGRWSSTDPKVRFAKLIAVPESQQATVAAIVIPTAPRPCVAPDGRAASTARGLSQLGVLLFRANRQLIVLESGEGPRLPYAGRSVHWISDGKQPVAWLALASDGTITTDDSGWHRSSAHVTSRRRTGLLATAMASRSLT